MTPARVTADGVTSADGNAAGATSAGVKRGFCPGLYDPMESGDGLLVRVRPPLGQVRVAQALALARAARNHGNGCIELTNRGNLQIRGLAKSGIVPFAAAMAECGLALEDAGAERRRRVIASPAGGEDAAAIEAAFVADTAFDALPAKFVVLAGAGGAADITVCGGRLQIAGAHRAVWPDGSMGAAVARVARVFLVLRQAEDRMRALVARVGADAVYAAAGLRAGCDPVVVAPVPIGAVGKSGFCAGLAFGQVDAGIFSKVADLAQRLGDGVVRVTPWRSFLIAGVGDVGTLRDGLAGLGLIVEPGDMRRRVVACVGAPGCGAGSVAARGDAASLGVCGVGVHVSGCAKGCAHPGVSDVTLVGRAGFYDVVLNGRARDMPAARHLTVTQAREWILKALPLAGARWTRTGQSPALSP